MIDGDSAVTFVVWAGAAVMVPSSLIYMSAQTPRAERAGVIGLVGGLAITILALLALSG